jgi:hypothetical protein
MTSQQPKSPREQAFQVEQALQVLGDLIAQTPKLEEEFLRSRLEFLGAVQGGTLSDTDLAEAYDCDPARERRHLEWFLFDRPSSVLSGLPFDVLTPAWAALAEELPEPLEPVMLQTVCGIFEVLEVDSSGVAQISELAGLTRLTLGPQSSTGGLGLGDLLVGRFYPFEGGRHEPSSALGFFRNTELVSALHRDLGKLREQQTRAVMRLTQRELERMFWPLNSPSSGDVTGDDESHGDPVGELESFLRENGIPNATVESWKRNLANSAPPKNVLISGADDLVGVLLENLAFETTIDLQRARSLFLAAWTVLHEKRPSRSEQASTDEPDSVEDSLREFDRDRAAGIDVDSSFRELERRLGLEENEEVDDGSAPDFPGVVGAMVTEFLWERSTSESEAQDVQERAAWTEGLGLFSEYTEKIGVFENLCEREVLTFLTFWLPESRRLQRGEQARSTVQAVTAFARWAEAAHCVEIIGQDLGAEDESLEQNLARVVEANSHARAEQAGELFEFRGTPSKGQGMIRDEQGDQRLLSFDGEILKHLKSGDLLRGYTGDDGRFVVGCCYPPQARGLRQRLASGPDV